MSAGAYALGWVRLVVVGGALAIGAYSLRRWLLPLWEGAQARLAEISIAVLTVVLVSEILGAFGWFRRWPVLAGIVLVSLAMGAISNVAAQRETIPTADARKKEPRWELIAATAGVAIVTAQWCGKIAFAYAHGMTHPDTVGYHAPYAVAFVQRGHLLGQLDRRDPLHAYAAHTSELLHALLILVLGRDVLSPLVNLGWFGVALLAAWCIGHRYGFGSLCILGAAVALGLPTIVSTHPGQASNDVAAATLVLAAIALLLKSDDLTLVPTTLAALVAGLAFSTKITATAPVAVLTFGVIGVAIARRKALIAIAWCVALFCAGSYWVTRNLIVAHNPFPYYTMRLGFVTFTRVPQRRADAVADQILNRATWRGFYLPGLRVALGDTWPLVLGIGVLGSIAVVVRKNTVFLRVAAIAGIAGFVAYLFTPYTADSGLAFTFNVRYAEPAFLTMLTIAPLAIIGARAKVRLGVAAALLVALVVDALAANHERLAAWPAHSRVVAVLAGAFIVALVAVYATRPFRIRSFVPIVFALAFVFGYPVQRYYAQHRYAAAGLPLDSVNAALQPVHDSRIAYFGTAESYPFYGATLTNRVETPAGPADTISPADCRTWIRELAPYQYIVLGNEVFVYDPVERIVAPDQGVQKIAGDATGALYQVVAPLAGNAC